LADQKLLVTQANGSFNTIVDYVPEPSVLVIAAAAFLVSVFVRSSRRRITGRP
jgi:hypothetical protein